MTTPERDAVLARFAEARVIITTMSAGVDEALELFLTPDEDPKKLGRKELVTELLDSSGLLSRVLETAQGLNWGFEDITEDEEDDDVGEDDVEG